MTTRKGGISKTYAPNGTRVIADTDEVENLTGTCIMAQEDAVFTKVTGLDQNDEEIDFMTHEDYMWTQLIASGCPLIAADNHVITNVKLSEGIVNVYK